MANIYKKTMNLPKTDFPMRAGLPQNEPKRLEYWEKTDIYERVLKQNEGHESFILHDGPPYANGPIHIGHAFNKTLKDFIIKYKSQRGFYAPYTPGWDCHGQPIEHMVEEKLGPEKMKKIDQVTLRRLCHEWAEKYVDIQREGFKRLGVRGDWDNPYLTFLPAYEAGNVKIFKKLYLDGSIYRGSKPIHWCMHCHTALAEAEIEYADEKSPSIYVKFDYCEAPEAFASSGMPVKIVIWTTTPWTLPANGAVCLAPDADYVAVVRDGELLVMAEELVGSVAETVGWDDVELYADADGQTVRLKGNDMLLTHYRTPIFPERLGTVIVGDHVEMSTGTGAVHTAPGHGQDDYLVCIKYDIPVIMPVDDNGVFDEDGGPFAGMQVWDANPKIISWLDERGLLLASVEVVHSYPHCWRCHEPVIFRATNQWFVSMEDTGLREKALAAIDSVNWIPSWAVNRIRAMIEDRPDWCISRQRSWGVPIPVFRCRDCGAVVATEQTFDAVIKLFEEQGSDAWFKLAPSEYLPEGVHCEKCGCTEVVPEKDILDVWWESGVSHTSCLETNPRLHRPADLYLEGSDQHRGWFQSSLLTSVGAYGISPYKSCMSCGFTVDGEGRKMSKSLGNGIDPADVIKKSGADVLRLWNASVDASVDVSISDEILKRTSESYRHIRNTFRFLLGNLYDFDRDDAVAFLDMPAVDRWNMARLVNLLARVTEAYDAFQFHVAYREMVDYTKELSNVYFDLLKDRLYSEAPDSPARRSAQTVLMNVLEVLVRIWGPVLTFTCDEVWDHIPKGIKKCYPADV
ncbi:MAG: isoleucine--tRNA ligase, partial [Coriobacteriales bacterium]